MEKEGLYPPTQRKVIPHIFLFPLLVVVLFV